MDNESHLRAQLAAARTENAAIRLRVCDAHAAVYRAMRAPPEESLAALQDDGYVHEAVHRILAGPDGTAQAAWDAATRDHLAALGERALRAEAEIDELRETLSKLQNPSGVVTMTNVRTVHDLENFINAARRDGRVSDGTPVRVHTGWDGQQLLPAVARIVEENNDVCLLICSE